MKSVYRSNEQSWGFIVIGLLFSGAMLGSAITTPSFSLVARVVITLVALGYGLFTFRSARAAVHATQDGIKIVNPMKNVTISWQEIEGFSLRPYGWLFVTGHADLRNGQSVHIWGIQPPSLLFRPKNQAAQRHIESLNEELRNARLRSQTP